jgi:hypothetical protein
MIGKNKKAVSSTETAFRLKQKDICPLNIPLPEKVLLSTKIMRPGTYI